MSDTPRTDAHYGRLPNDRQTRGSVQDYEHARQLERELAEKEAALASILCCVPARSLIKDAGLGCDYTTEAKAIFFDAIRNALASLPQSAKQGGK